MSRPTGLPKTGGRTKGTLNKRTEAFASKLDELNLDLLAEIAKILPELEPERRVHTLIAMLPYCYSKANAEVEVQLTEEPVSQLSDEELDERIIQLTAKIEKSDELISIS